MPGNRFCTSCGVSLAVPGARRPQPRRTHLVIALMAAVAVPAVVAVAQLTRSSLEAADSDVPRASSSASSSREPSASAGLGAPFGSSRSAEVMRCASGELECERLVVPADHDDRGSGEDLEVVFGRHRADPDRRRGTLVIATGGPGTSGIELAPDYLSTFPDSVLDRYDIVFFEQRGVGRSAGIDCREADLDVPDWGSSASDDIDPSATRAETWVEACLEEAGVDDPSRLEQYATAQAAADLDAYLDHIDAGEVVLYGESYGTQLVQVYAARRPERVSGLILDAVVDPTLDAVEATIQQAAAFSDVLDRLFAACNDDEFCADDFGDSSAAAAWDRLADALRDGPIAVALPSRDGQTVEVELSFDAVVRTAGGLLYDEQGRVLLLRSLASAGRDDLRPLVRMAGISAGLDPETGRPLSRLDDSSAGFYAISCQDYQADRELGTLRLGDGYQRLIDDGARLASIVLDQLPCVTGFAGSRDGSPLEATSAADHPVLVLTSTADPATPMAWAEAVAERMTNAYLVVTNEGGHGTFGWGLPCPDDIVKEFLVFGDLPEARRTECDGYLMEPYLPVPLGGPNAYPDVLAALVAVEETIAMLPDYVYWDGAPRRLGCPHGGWMQMTWGANDDTFDLHACQILADWPIDGTIEFTADFTTTMDLELPNGEVTYVSTELWEVTVEGVIDGEPVELEQKY